MKNFKRMLLQLICLAIMLFLGGCQKQHEDTAPIILNLSPTQEEQPESISEATEASDESFPESETTVVHTASLTSKPEEANTNSISLIEITKDFYPLDGWTSTFAFKLPEDWNYTVDEDTTDWGFFIQVNDREDSSIRIYGQQGTLNVEQFYTNAPMDFVTNNGIQGKFYQEKHTAEDGSSYVEGDIVFDLQFYYCISFYMPEDVFDKNQETLQNIFKSVMIEDTALD